MRLRGALASRDEVLEAYLFGSVGRGEARAHSDVDVAVFVDAATVRDDGFGYEATLSADLANVLGTDRVDVVRLNRAPPLLYHRVLRDGIRLLSRDLTATTTRALAVLRLCASAGQDRARRASAAPGRSVRDVTPGTIDRAIGCTRC